MLPPLPPGYRPFSELADSPLSDRQLLLLFCSLCEALAVLHRKRFTMGFLVPEQLYFHPETLEILLDIQAYPSAFPFVKHALAEYPFSLLSRYARHHVMPRTADFCAVGHLLRSARDESAMSESLRWLTCCLMEAPESFLFAEEIRNWFWQEAGGPEEGLWTVPDARDASLHPMAPPLDQWQQNQLRAFLRSGGERLIGLICKDEATRLDVYHQHFNEVMESDYFFTIVCRNLPFATIRELIERTTIAAHRFFGRNMPALHTLTRKLNRIFQQHYVGDDIIHSLSEWLFQFYTALTPMMEWQHFYYAFEHCEHFDEDSQRVLLRFWQNYHDQITNLFAIFSGKRHPSLIPGEGLHFLRVGGKHPPLYKRVLLSHLGRADARLLDQLSQWFTQRQTEFHHCRLFLEKWIEDGLIVLTPDGWSSANQGSLAQKPLSPSSLIAERIGRLSTGELDLLRTLTCLPMPVRAGDLFSHNGLDPGELYDGLSRLLALELIPVYHPNCVYVPAEVARQVLHTLPHEEQTGYYRRAMQLQAAYRPENFQPLVELAHLAGDKRAEYAALMRYYRQIRHLLTLERQLDLLQELKDLQQTLKRDRVCCWERLLVQVCMRLNLYQQAEQLASALYERTGAAKDRFFWIRVLLFTKQTYAAALKADLIRFVEDAANPLADRSWAAYLLAYVDFFSPLYLGGAAVIDRFYRQELYPQREQISIRLFAQLTTMYIIVLFQYFPDASEWSSALRKKLESLLETSYHPDLMIELYNSYIFDNNVHVARAYNQRQLEMTKRYGFTAKLQISHLNGMELCLYHGDLHGYRYHLENVMLVDEIKRVDLLEQYVTHQLLYACEWQQEEDFRRLEQEQFSRDFGDWAVSLRESYNRYLAYLQGRPLPPSVVWREESDLSLFVDGLYAAEKGDVEEACRLFQRSIETNGFRLVAGWSYREMIRLLLQTGSPEVEPWLRAFETYLNAYGYDLFWPDFYHASATWWLRQGNVQQALMFMRRAANGYQLIQKDAAYQQVQAELQRVMQPSFLPDDSSLRAEPLVQQLMATRMQLLEQSLDLQIIIQLSERVTSSLELNGTMQRLVYALFEYFPISRLTIHYDLFFRREKVHCTFSGTLSAEELVRLKNLQQTEQHYRYPLFAQNGQSIELEVYSGVICETKERHMKQFLSFIKPHVANALLYMEMMIDNLTGFYQRRYFLSALQAEMDLAVRYDLGLSLIMLDIDNFRQVNEHGHQEGDRVLREISDIIRSLLRKHDIPGRFGGEEMLLILPKTDGKEALRLAERIRREIEEQFAVDRPYRVTVSVGVSSLDRSETTSSDELIRLADDAEIRAKRTGKNRVAAAWT